jgi:hypothetical protein
MTDRTIHNEHTPERADVRTSWTRARLIKPTSSGFVHVGASSGRWALPFALPRARRRALLAAITAAAAALRRDSRVLRADVFRGLVRPPDGDLANSGVPAADFDAVLLIETRTVADASTLRNDDVVAGLMAELAGTAARTLVFTASNVRRMGPVDHERQGVFLFNYFAADDVDTNLHAWQYTAGWFHDETGLDNSTVLRPAGSQGPYTLVNHARWDRLSNVLPALLFKRSFRTFVLRVFADNRVTPNPVLYRLHNPADRE